MLEQVFRVRDIKGRIVDLDVDIKHEKNKKEQARLTDEQAALKFALRTVQYYTCTHDSLTLGQNKRP